MGNSTKELVNAFNLNNYFSDKINTNFIVEDKKIFGLFASSTNIGEYLQRIGEKIIKRHYLSRTEVASRYYNLNCFPFVLGANPDKEYLGNGIVKVKLADSTNPAVIHNLKVHFANEFKKTVISKVVACLQKEAGRTKEQAYEWIEGTVQTGAIGSPYLYCIAFSNEYLEKRYNQRIFELLKSLYIREFNSRLEACGLKSSDFYEYRDDVLYIKDVSDKVVKSVAEYVKEEVALDFRTPGKEDSKVENFKDVLSSLMSKQVRKSINVYDYDTFTDENEKNGHNFALIPFIEMDDGQYETLSSDDARNIDRIFNKEINKVVPNGFIPKNYDIISDIRGKTANPQYTNCKEPVYAFSNQQIALLLPMIMRSPIAYNEENKGFEFAVDLGNFKRRGSSRSSSKESTPTHLQNGGLPNGHLSEAQLESPTQSQGDALKESPRQGTETEKGLLGRLYNPLGSAVAGPSSAPSAGPSPWQPSGPSSSRGTQAGSEKEEKLIEALLDMFNFNNYIDEIHTNFTLENGKIVGFLNVDKGEYLQKVRNDIIKKHCGTEEEARKVYDFGQLPFVFPPDSNYEEDEGVTDIAYNVRGAVFNLKIHLIQEFKRGVEDEVIKKLEKEMKMKKEEVRKCIRKSVHLEKVSNPTSYLCDISFSNEYFQNQSELSEELGIDVETLFKEFKNIYVEEFKSRLKKCNLDVSLVSHDGNMLHIKNAIDIEFVKKVKKCARKEVPVNQFPRKEVIMEVPIVLQDGFYILDTSEIPSETRPPLRQRARPIEGTSKAGKGEPKGNQDSSYSSWLVTDAEKASFKAEERTSDYYSMSEHTDHEESLPMQQQNSWSENVSSKAEATTSSGYESMDCDNTGGGSPKRALELSMGMEELAISTTLNAPQSSPAKKLRRNEV